MTTLCTAFLIVNFACTIEGEPIKPQLPPYGPHLAGNLSEYGSSVMPYVIEYRLNSGEIEQWQVDAADVYLAVYHCDHIGQMGTLSYKGDDYTLLVTDCANLDHDSTRRLFLAGVIAEVDFNFAMVHGLQENGRYAELVIDE